MLDPKFVLENLESVQNRLASRGPRISFDEFVRVSREKKDVLKKTEDLRAVKNKASEEVSRLKKDGKDASAIIAAMRAVGDEIGAGTVAGQVHAPQQRVLAPGSGELSRALLGDQEVPPQHRRDVIVDRLPGEVVKG